MITDKPPKVYIVHGRILHEGMMVLGVFLTERSAKLRVAELTLSESSFDDFDYVEWEVET